MTKFDNARDLGIAAGFTIGAEAANAIAVTIQLKDRKNGGDLAERAAIHWYLSADTNGDAIAVVPDGGIAIGTDGLLIEWTANLSGIAIRESDGDIDVVITESTANSFYLILVMPDGKLYSSGAITFA